MPKKELILITEQQTIVSERDIKMVQMAADDFTRGEIATEFELSQRTVESIFDKLKAAGECKSMPALIALFFRKKLIK